MAPRVASLSVALTDEDLTATGVLSRLLQPLALQGVNLVEVSSTTRESHVYLSWGEVMLALDSPQRRFRASRMKGTGGVSRHRPPGTAFRSGQHERP